MSTSGTELNVSQARASGWKQIAAAYMNLMKPEITLLVLITTVTAMWMVPGQSPSWTLVLLTTLGTALASGSAATLNCYADRDLDVFMTRTSKRSIPSGKVTPEHALIFGIAIGVISVALLAVFVNLLSAALALFANLFYVLVYTLWLKRSTPQNIVIGGAAGAIPPMIGWAAVTGTVGLPAIVLFLIIFLWTPPHFWALALFRAEDYRKAGVPMLPVVRGAEETKRQILVYSILLTLSSVVLYPLGAAGPVYLVTSLVLGGRLIQLALHVQKDETFASARRLFGYSISYLALLFLVLAVDISLLGGGGM